ncbi:MAG: hypothetical protein ABI640_08115 [Gammaproteobacteria bacterium]
MSITIRTRRAMGEEHAAEYRTEAAASRALERDLTAHRRAGHHVTQVGNIYMVTDHLGTLVQRTEVVRPKTCVVAFPIALVPNTSVQSSYNPKKKDPLLVEKEWHTTAWGVSLIALVFGAIVGGALYWFAVH